jgi:SAM-dependent methyltransferase
MLFGFMRTQALSVAAKLGLADIIGDEPRDIGDVARQAGAHESSLYRLLRLLTSEGVFDEVEPGKFAANRLSDGLRSSAPLTMRYIAIAMGGEQYRGWAAALHTFVTGEPGFDKEYGVPYFAFLSQHPEESAVFNRAMAAGTRARVDALLSYDWTGHKRVADIGGGSGTAIAAVLWANPHLQGAVFDLPNVVDDAHQTLDDAGVADRCEVVGGDFFIDPLPPADAYVLAQILHDWNDERAGAILRNCRRSIADGGRLLVIDGVVPPGSEPGFLKHMDLHMLVLVGGKERTEREWRDLLAREAFEIEGIIPAGPANLIEARPT